MSKLKHSNIVEFMGACMTPPDLCFVMELCTGSLYGMLHEKRDPFSEQDAVQMCIDIGSAVEYLHAQTPVIIHRDIKSHNVLVAPNGAFKVSTHKHAHRKQTNTPSLSPLPLLSSQTDTLTPITAGQRLQAV